MFKFDNTIVAKVETTSTPTSGKESEYGTAGIICIVLQDTLSKTLRLITNQQFDGIGIYYRASLYNPTVYNTAIFHVYYNSQISWLRLCTLQDIMTSSLVTKIILLPLGTSDDMRVMTAKVVKDHPSTIDIRTIYTNILLKAITGTNNLDFTGYSLVNTIIINLNLKLRLKLDLPQVVDQVPNDKLVLSLANGIEVLVTNSRQMVENLKYRALTDEVSENLQTLLNVTATLLLTNSTVSDKLLHGNKLLTASEPTNITANVTDLGNSLNTLLQTCTTAAPIIDITTIIQQYNKLASALNLASLELYNFSVTAVIKSQGEGTIVVPLNTDYKVITNNSTNFDNFTVTELEDVLVYLNSLSYTSDSTSYNDLINKITYHLALREH